MGPPIRYRYILLGMAIILSVAVSFILFPASPGSGITREATVTFHPPHTQAAATLEVELADTPSEHSTGLMNRPFLGQAEGMLFIFKEDGHRSFWMMNTLIPLDMIFINSSLHIVRIQEAAPPCETPSCPTYPSGRPAKYVVEANGGFAHENHIEAGQTVTLNLP